MGSTGAVKLRCPDCGKALGPLAESVVCPGCGRQFAPSGGVWDLRPATMASVKVNEDWVHEEEGLPSWRRLFYHKRYWIEWCETLWFPTILSERTRTFLEIGGGLCYASALAKARIPHACVVATDVSPHYLRRHALRVGEIMESPADVYAAADAETLPFDDGQFDAVYSQIVLYRLPDPARALREIQRVLAPRGRYLGVERASPWAWPFFAREACQMAERARRLGVSEQPIRYRDWEKILEAAGLPRTALAPVPGHRIRSPRLRRLGNAMRQIYVTIGITR